MTGNNNRWRKSSFSGGTQNACVELDRHTGGTAIRDSKNPAAGALVVPPPEWAAFLSIVKHGALDA